jgi:hypothetical protein
MATTKRTQGKNDVARRLSGIRALFVAAESPKTAKAFTSGDNGGGVPAVPEVDLLEEIGTFSNITNSVESALTTAITAFGGYSGAEFDGDVQGAAAEVHADVRALTNVALGLSPPSRAFYNKVLGGLVAEAKDAGLPSDGGPVPYPPMRVSLEEMDMQKRGRGSSGTTRVPNTLPPGSPPAAVLRVLIRLQNRFVSTYVEKIPDGTAAATKALTPLVHAAKADLQAFPNPAADAQLPKLLAKTTITGNVENDLGKIESLFSLMFGASDTPV